MNRTERNTELREHLKRLAEWTDYTDQLGRLDLLCKIVFYAPDLLADSDSLSLAEELRDACLTRLSENDEEIMRLREAAIFALGKMDRQAKFKEALDEARERLRNALAPPASI